MNCINKAFLTKTPMKFSTFSALPFLLTFFFLSSCQRALPPLKMLVMPIDTVENTKSTYAPFVSYLEESVNRKVNLVTPATYDEVKKLLLSSSSYDIVNLNGVLYSQYYNPKKFQVFAQETSGGETTYNSVFISHRDSDIFQISDIKDSVLALNNRYSTSGALVPIIMLKDANLSPGSDYKYKFTESHLSSAQSVLDGDSNAAAVSWKSFKNFIRDKKLNPNSLRIIGVSFPIPLDPWLINKELPNSTKEIIFSSFYDLSDRTILDSLGTDGFVPANESNFDSIDIDKTSVYTSILAE